MNAANIHLAITHFPIIGAIIGVGILLYGQIIKNNSFKNLAYGLFILMALLTIPVFSSGEGAEEVVEHIAGVSENIIEEHEHLAEKAIWLMGLLGIFSLLGIFANRNELTFANTVGLIILVISLITSGVFIQVGHLGGQIRHTEIRSETTSNNQKGEDHDNDHDEDHDEDHEKHHD
ncbi:MAG: hypothetical protein OEX02_17940 [Cyclobacteriaceae bacterium]|nr:hypothetical protein [Cyclobacteriaceae bacterium]